MKPEILESLARKLIMPLGENLVSVQRLSGGGNNQAYWVETTQRKYFLKLYHIDAEDPRRRGPTEFQWLKALWQNGVRKIPEPIGFHESTTVSAGLYEYLPGKPIKSEDLAADDTLVGHAAQFIRSINTHRTHEQSILLPAASEACFSLSDHYATVERRVARLKLIDASVSPIHAEVVKFVSDAVEPAWRKYAKPDLAGFEKTLPTSDRILSPSDFGFHNAIRTISGDVRFIDFEYAGWDDPAKLICDFFHQVSVPVPARHYRPFLQELMKIVPESSSDDLIRRVAHLYPIYGIKWVCILLNHFSPAGERRRKFALQNPDTWEKLLQQQLQNAEALLRTLDVEEFTL